MSAPTGVHCTNCGTQNAAENRFCVSCGAPIDAPVAPTGVRRRRRRGLFALAAGVAIIAAVGAVAALALTRGSTGGGASSPGAAVSQLVTAIQKNDLLAAADVVPPDERRDLPELVKRLTDKVKSSGITGGVLPKLTANIEQAPTTQLAADVDGVQVSGQVGIDVGAVEGRIGQLLGPHKTTHPDHDFILPGAPGEGPYSRQEAPPLRLIAIRQHGRWYVDPLLTAGDYLATRLSLPGGDYSQAGFHTGSGGSSPADAVSRFLDAVASKDPIATADVAAPADERFLRVFAGAISSYVGRFSRTLSVSDLQLSNDGTGEVGVHGLTVATQDPYGDPTTVYLHSLCVHWTRTSGGTSQDLCIPTQNALRTKLGLNVPELNVAKDGDSYRVSAVRSVTSLLATIGSRLDSDTLKGLAGRLEPSPPPASTIPPTSVGDTIDGAYDGVFYHVFALQNLMPGQRVTLTPNQDTMLEVSGYLSLNEAENWCIASAGQPCSITAPTQGQDYAYVFVLWPWETKSPECRSAGTSMLTGCWWVPGGARYHVTITAG